ncbi:protein kinase, putative [Ichthyophthirius multifiliis]|uniref:Protein kinase, putative n=1 Tax=Ichthyophthirius multifiliis TaxID=5932 RepID=G0R6P1_ICHMU|nr:protein kinase, putative [Ichthyophthirius multifiliis]EGR26863.1 protein kinase, putative [Ichthyophthirius multifiliis]|eukprot:XP_004023747.1 protein kinase, putative [Ichthyophthirius multifiliis]
MNDSEEQKNQDFQDYYLRQKYIKKLGIVQINEIVFYPQQNNEQKKEAQLMQQQIEINLQLENTYEQNGYQMKFHSRSDDDVRNKYIKKLQNQKILKQNQTQKHQSLIIFDWDDTILCTKYLQYYDFVDIPIEILRQLSFLDNSASKLLKKATTYGNTYIITNAIKGWVQYSSQLFLPKVFNVINENQITVISARTEFEDVFPGDCLKWKVETFKNLKKFYDEDLITNLICLGDSNIEIDALHILAKGFNQSLIKTIKFKENPNPEELARQQELVNDKFDQIYLTIKNLTIRLEKKNNIN